MRDCFILSESCSLSLSLFLSFFLLGILLVSHTKGHISYFVTAKEEEDPAVFTGDTLVSGPISQFLVVVISFRKMSYESEICKIYIQVLSVPLLKCTTILVGPLSSFPSFLLVGHLSYFI